MTGTCFVLTRVSGVRCGDRMQELYSYWWRVKVRTGEGGPRAEVGREEDLLEGQGRSASSG